MHLEIFFFNFRTVLITILFFGTYFEALLNIMLIYTYYKQASKPSSEKYICCEHIALMRFFAFFMV